MEIKGKLPENFLILGKLNRINKSEYLTRLKRRTKGLMSKYLNNWQKDFSRKVYKMLKTSNLQFIKGTSREQTGERMDREEEVEEEAEEEEAIEGIEVIEAIEVIEESEEIGVTEEIEEIEEIEAHEIMTEKEERKKSMWIKRLDKNQIIKKFLSKDSINKKIVINLYI